MSISVRVVTRSGPKRLGYKMSSFSSSHCATHSSALVATARTNARETLAQTIEAAELLTWKNIGSGHRGGPARGSPASERPAALRNGWGRGGRGPEPAEAHASGFGHAEGEALPADAGGQEVKVPE